MIVFSRPLPGLDGKPLAQIIVRNEMPALEQLNRSNAWLIRLLLLFALVLLFLIYTSLVRWVSRPLRLIMESLNRNDPKPIDGMCRGHFRVR